MMLELEVFLIYQHNYYLIFQERRPRRFEESRINLC